MQNEEPFYNHFWFVCGILTILYLVLGLMFGGVAKSVVPIIGLFVPFGIGNTLVALSSVVGLFSFDFFHFVRGLTGLIPIALLILSFYYADSVAFRLKMTGAFKKIVFSLTWLFFLTLFVDLILWQTWDSMGILLHCPAASEWGPAKCGGFIF